MKPLDPRLLRAARATRTHIVVCVVLGTMTAGLVLAQAELLSSAIADVVDHGMRRSALDGVLTALAAVVLGRTIVAWVTESASKRASAAVKSQLRRRVIAHAAELGPAVDGSNGRAAVATLACRGMDALDGYFGRYLPQLVLAIIIPVVVLARLVRDDLVASATIAFTLPLIPVFMILVGRMTEASNAKRWESLGRLSHHFLDIVTGLVTLKIFGRAKAQAASVRRSTDQYRTTTMATLRIAFLSSLVLELIATLSVALVAVGVGLRLVDGGLDLRTGLLIILLAPEAYLPLRQVGAQYHAAAEGVAAADHAFAILEAPLPASGDEVVAPDLRDHGWIRIDHVSVVRAGRPGAAPHAAELVAGHGRITVITGASGAGKSSLLAVLTGALAPTSGSVTLGGADREMPLAALDLAVWRRQLAWVDQHPYLFDGTLADNVRISRPDATDRQVRDAVDAVGLVAMDLERPIGERGATLSAGERRRIAVARAMLRDAPVVLLDEPTAGLDEDSERCVLDAVRAMAANSIVIMVSHRPAAIEIADQVVTLQAMVDA